MEKLKNNNARMPRISVFLLCLIQLCILLLIPTSLFSLDPSVPVDRYLMDEWDTSHGLVKKSIYSIVQSPDGYLWLADQSNLIRYDGKKFDLIRNNEINISASELRLSPEGVLYFGTARGEFFQYQNGMLQKIPVSDYLKEFLIRTTLTDSKGAIWIGTILKHLERQQNGKVTTFENIQSISSIIEDTYGNIWVGAFGQGVFLYKKGKFENYTLDILQSPYSVTNLYEDREQRFWICTDSGLILLENPLDPQKRKIKCIDTATGLSADIVFEILEDSDGNIWVGTTNGLNRLQVDTNGNISFELLLEEMHIISLYEDRERSLWIGTYCKNLKRLRDGAITTNYRFKGISPYKPCLFKGSDGRLWLGGNEGNLAHCPGTDLSRLTFSLQGRHSTEQGIGAMDEDTHGNLWVGTDWAGFFQLKDGRVHQPWDTMKQIDYHTRSILCDSSGRVWVATTKGLFCKPGEDEPWIKYTEKYEGLKYEILNLYEDKNKNLWVCTAKGVDVFADGLINYRNYQHYLDEFIVYSIREDNELEGVYWAGTLLSGLIRFQKGKTVVYKKKDGLGSNVIYNVMEDNRGYFWMGSLDGILRVSKGELESFAAGNLQQLDCVTFGHSDGMKSVRCWNYAANSMIKTDNGEMWFSTEYGISRVDPENVKIDRTPPMVAIKAVRFNGRHVTLPNRTDLNGLNTADIVSFKGIRDVHLEFAALTFLDQERVKFKTKLEGYDEQWTLQESMDERAVHYSDLPFGIYTFRVTACKSNGTWSKPGASFTFRLEPYFYQTLIFKLLLGFIIIGTAVFIYIGTRKYIYLKKIENKYKSSTLQRERVDDYLKKLYRLLEEEKVYRDEELSLQSLSEQLEITPRNLSQLVNETLDKNFSDFINGYRVKEAKQRLLDPANRLSILEIGIEVGFYSRTSFYRAFKRDTGMSPSDFKKEALRKT